MVVLTYVVNLLLFIVCLTKSKTAQGAMTNTQRGDFQYLPLVVNTWPFTNATSAGWSSITSGGSSLDAVELGCSTCEQEQCDGSVGFGNHPDETGETTLDAMIMDGVTHDVGSVGCLRRVKSAMSVARAVMNYTKHTLLVGELATQFAVEMGFKEESLSTNTSIDEWRRWKDHNCQPNFRQNVKPDPTKSCGPYHPFNSSSCHRPRYNEEVTRGNHDTIGMIVVDKNGNIAGGTTTNGANHKVPGRVGDSPIVGAGCYVDNNIGGAVATGDGDVMMRFLPSLRTVENMKQGMSPSSACEAALQPIIKYYPDFSGAVVAASKQGIHGAACYGFDTFHYSAYFTGLKSPKIEAIPCMQKTK
ncbi:N(4)-(Beta-N-acetylglucosaminyl)-L-asparaginase-like [Acanthaster planci]|uniref:N(4)-(beta-N-acetylglucosaminyl)-L-asparaginase n=1 Tax=Acanthaster planci TaxID=133434 RepID=A0A8B7ZZJ1_ACAPL|nr:N(4)-(Beta-N-acetylglucosaminyl)-L-asparaginase-like [Acanthaster planci]